MVNVKNKKRVLYFFTTSFPYGSGETFIENEIQFLSKKFNKIFIISNDMTSNDIRHVPANVYLERIRYELTTFEKFLSIFYLSRYVFWKELFHVKTKYNRRITLGIVKTALSSLYSARRLSKQFTDMNIVNGNSIYYSYWSNDSAIALALLKNNINIKCFSRIHGWDVFFGPSKYNYLPFRNLISENLDAIYSISQEGINYCNTYWKIKNSSILKLSRLGVKNGIYFDENNSNFQVVSCSRLISLKRVDLLVHSLAKIKFNIKWTHFGHGEKFDEIVQLSKKKLPDNVEFEFKGLVENKLVLKYYKLQRPSLFVNLSSSEGVPVSIMEAMSFGIPAIATNVGGTSEIVNNDNGFLIDNNPSPVQVSEKITEYYLLSRDDKNKKRHSAYKTWNEKYNADKNYTQFVEDILCL